MKSFMVFQLGLAFLGIITIVYHRYFRRNASLSLPPGPKPLPIVGNIRDLPPKGRPEYQHWLKHKDIYGPVSSVTVFGQPIVILHDKTATRHLLDKHSLKTSRRPTAGFAMDCGFGDLLSFRQYNDTFRLHRKLIHQQMGTVVHASRFNDVQDVESRRFLLRILNDPNNLIQHIKTEASAIILKMTYGYSIKPHSADPLVVLIEQAMDNISQAFVPLAWMVDIFPILKYLPEGFPGTSFKATARKWNQITQAMTDVPYSFARRDMANETHQKSYVSSLLQKHGVNPGHGDTQLTKDDEDAIKQTAAIMYAGGSDTTVSNLSSFVLAMIMFPKVQERAQKEIDDVIGTNRLPGFADKERLPYIDAVVKEALRWLPVTPAGPAHATEEEMAYAGYKIPKGSYLLPMIWWFLHDPDTYANPDAFDPERYMEPRNEPDPRAEVFGYGRRICPGRHLAFENLFITISRVLATFNISKALDHEGRELEVKLGITPGLIAHPEQFPYKVQPRNARFVELIRSVEVDHPWEASDAGLLQGDVSIH